MHLPSFFGVGGSRTVSLNACAAATVTAVKCCWWLKVNTQPVRIHGSAGARCPHIVRFRYEVNGTKYSAARFLGWQDDPPVPGQQFRLFYDPSNPKRFAVPAF